MVVTRKVPLPESPGVRSYILHHGQISPTYPRFKKKWRYLNDYSNFNCFVDPSSIQRLFHKSKQRLSSRLPLFFYYFIFSSYSRRHRTIIRPYFVQKKPGCCHGCLQPFPAMPDELGFNRKTGRASCSHAWLHLPDRRINSTFFIFVIIILFGSIVDVD